MRRTVGTLARAAASLALLAGCTAAETPSEPAVSSGPTEPTEPTEPPEPTEPLAQTSSPDLRRAVDVEGCRPRPVPRSIGPTVEGWGDPHSMRVCVYDLGVLVAGRTVDRSRAAAMRDALVEAQRSDPDEAPEGRPVPCPANLAAQRVLLRIRMVDPYGPRDRPTLRQDLLIDPSGCGSIDVPTWLPAEPVTLPLDRSMAAPWADLPGVRSRVPAPAGQPFIGSW